MTASEVAEYLGIGRSTVYQLPIPYHAYGSRRVYDLEDVQEYKKSCRRVPQTTSVSKARLSTTSTNEDSALRQYFKQRGIKVDEGNRVKRNRSKST